MKKDLGLCFAPNVFTFFGDFSFLRDPKRVNDFSGLREEVPTVTTLNNEVLLTECNYMGKSCILALYPDAHFFDIFSFNTESEKIERIKRVNSEAISRGDNLEIYSKNNKNVLNNRFYVSFDGENTLKGFNFNYDNVEFFNEVVSDEVFNKLLELNKNGKYLSDLSYEDEVNLETLKKNFFSYVKPLYRKQKNFYFSTSREGENWESFCVVFKISTETNTVEILKEISSNSEGSVITCKENIREAVIDGKDLLLLGLENKKLLFLDLDSNTLLRGEDFDYKFLKVYDRETGVGFDPAISSNGYGFPSDIGAYRDFFVDKMNIPNDEKKDFFTFLYIGKGKKEIRTLVFNKNESVYRGGFTFVCGDSIYITTFVNSPFDEIYSSIFCYKFESGIGKSNFSFSEEGTSLVRENGLEIVYNPSKFFNQTRLDYSLEVKDGELNLYSFNSSTGKMELLDRDRDEKILFTERKRLDNFFITEVYVFENIIVPWQKAFSDREIDVEEMIFYTFENNRLNKHLILLNESLYPYLDTILDEENGFTKKFVDRGGKLFEVYLMALYGACGFYEDVFYFTATNRETRVRALYKIYGHDSDKIKIADIDVPEGYTDANPMLMGDPKFEKVKYSPDREEFIFLFKSFDLNSQIPHKSLVVNANTGVKTVNDFSSLGSLTKKCKDTHVPMCRQLYDFGSFTTPKMYVGDYIFPDTYGEIISREFIDRFSNTFYLTSVKYVPSGNKTKAQVYLLKFNRFKEFVEAIEMNSFYVENDVSLYSSKEEFRKNNAKRKLPNFFDHLPFVNSDFVSFVSQLSPFDLKIYR